MCPAWGGRFLFRVNRFRKRNQRPGETASGKAEEGQRWRGKSNVGKNGESRKPQMADSCVLQGRCRRKPNSGKELKKNNLAPQALHEGTLGTLIPSAEL
jgi:hypothetical protein